MHADRRCELQIQYRRLSGRTGARAAGSARGRGVVAVPCVSHAAHAHSAIPAHPLLSYSARLRFSQVMVSLLWGRYYCCCASKAVRSGSSLLPALQPSRTSTTLRSSTSGPIARSPSIACDGSDAWNTNQYRRRFRDHQCRLVSTGVAAAALDQDATAAAATAATPLGVDLRYLSAWFCPFAHRATLALEHHAQSGQSVSPLQQLSALLLAVKTVIAAAG
jgi:hypothetical protein